MDTLFNDVQEAIATHATESESEECIKKEAGECGKDLKAKLLKLPKEQQSLAVKRLQEQA